MLHFQARNRSSVDGSPAKETPLLWNPRQTALVICDIWDAHTCPNAAARAAEMAPRIDAFAREARRQGVLIIHCPSDTMAFYKDYPGRRLAISAPVATPPVPLQRWRPIDPASEAPLPIDDSDGGCDCATPWKKGDRYPWTRENVIVCGVHLNMCVLRRPFAIGQMVSEGKHVVLLRDLTDSLYNPAMPPYVSHFDGTRLMISHVETYWCPTITSDALLGGEPFRFKGDTEAGK